MFPASLIMAVMAGNLHSITITASDPTGSVSDPTNSNATVIFNADGTIDHNEDTSVFQVNAGTDWIIPNVDASGDFDVKYDYVSGDILDVEAAADGVYIALSSNRGYGVTQNSVGNTTSVVTFTIRDPQGRETTSAPITLSATVSA